MRNQESLVAVGETNIFVLNELKQKWEVVSQAPLDENYRKLFKFIFYLHKSVIYKVFVVNDLSSLYIFSKSLYQNSLNTILHRCDICVNII